LASISHGSAIYVDTGVSSVSNSLFEYHVSEFTVITGSTIYLGSGQLSIDYSRFYNNNYYEGDSQFVSVSAVSFLIALLGGIIYFFGGVGAINHTVFIDNTHAITTEGKLCSDDVMTSFNPTNLLFLKGSNSIVNIDNALFDSSSRLFYIVNGKVKVKASQLIQRTNSGLLSLV